MGRGVTSGFDRATADNVVRTTTFSRDRLEFVWSVAAEDVLSNRVVIALIAGGRSVFEPWFEVASSDPGECCFFVESHRGEVGVQILADLGTSRVFVSMRFDLAKGGAEALRLLRSQTLLTIHAVSLEGALLGTAHVEIGVARAAWLDSALARAARGASAG